MDSEDEGYEAQERLLSKLAGSSPSDTSKLQQTTATLHAAALQSTQSPQPHLQYLQQALSKLPLPFPPIQHPFQHSANTLVVLSHHQTTPNILHVHSTDHKPSFPTLLTVSQQFLQLTSHTDAASRIASSLRHAVSAREPVTLVVVHLDTTNALLPAVPVAHALADRFNARVHLTGAGCLSAFRGITLVADSVGMDLGAAFGVRGCGYITFGVDQVKELYGEVLLPHAVCMRYLLETFPVHAIKQLLNRVVGVVEKLSDSLYRVEHLWKMDVLADGEARMRYAGKDAREVEAAVVKADKTGLLQLSDGLFISATSALRRHQALPENVVRLLCELLIRVAREYELAKLARSAFIARLRQCQHVEVKPGEGLVLCILSVVPLGHVPPAGRWRTDEESRSIVMDFTKRITEEAEGEQLPVITDDTNGVGAVVVPRLTCVIEDGIDYMAIAEECERLAEELLFDETRARSWGVRVAEGVVRRVVGVVEGIGVADGGLVRKEVDTVQEDSQRGPDGTVEVVQDVGEEVRDEVPNLNDGGVGESSGTARGEGSPDYDEKAERLERPETDSRTERTVQNGDAGPKPRAGLWGLIFGDRNSAETESDESSDGEGKQLEDDYFRL